MSASTQPRNLNRVLGEITESAQRVSIATRSWPAFLPKAENLDAVTETVDSLQRALAELRGLMVPAKKS